MFLAYFPILLIFSIASLTSSTTIINCPSQKFSVHLNNGEKVEYENVELFFEYDRNNLAVYQYPETPSVNLLLQNTVVSFKGECSYNNPEFNVQSKKFISSYTIGLANTVNNNGEQTLKDCTFSIRKQRNEKNVLPSELQDKVLNVASECLNTQLSQNLGALNKDDYSRAEQNPRDFGPMDIRSRSLMYTFPEMKAPQYAPVSSSQSTSVDPTTPQHAFVSEPQYVPAPRPKKANIVDGIKSIVSGLADLYSYSYGIIAIPDIEGIAHLYSAKDGYFGYLTDLQLSESSKVRQSPESENPNTVSFKIKLPNANVVYKEFKLVGPFSFGQSRQLRGNVQNLEFSVVIAIDFSHSSCKTSLVNFEVSDKGKPTVSVSGGYLSGVDNMLSYFVSAWNDNIVQGVKENVEYVLGSYLSSGKFNCENYRPHKG